MKEKSHWFQCLDGMSEKLEVKLPSFCSCYYCPPPPISFSEELSFVQMLKLEHNELLKNAKENKKCLETDFLQLSTALTRTGVCFLNPFNFLHLACCMLHFCN